MKFKTILPYLLFGTLAMSPRSTSDIESNVSDAPIATHITTQNVPNRQEQIDAKAQELCDVYIDSVLAGQKRIKHGKGGHRRAVLNEFPGAYVRWYCIYGQYVQLNRALDQLGDTLTIIPFEGRHSCPEFRRLMKQKYSGPEYANAIHNGKMYKSDKDYNNALTAFLKHNRVNESTPDSVRQQVIARFAKNNFSVESLHPGAILIYQKSSTPSNTHAVVYLGRGRVENGSFVPDKNGKHLYASYNNESIEDVFHTYSTNRMFVADIHDIATVEYAKELDKIQHMEYDDLFRYVYEMPSDMYVMTPSKRTLGEMAAQKYFEKQNFKPGIQPVQQNMASVAPFPKLLKNSVIQQKLGLVK